MESIGTLSNPYGDLPKERRRRLTASLLHQASEAAEPERSGLLDQVVLVNMCVARSIASRYRARSIPIEDLEQVANAALVRAVHHFDLDRERDLLSYAVPSIRGELRRHFRDQGWTVRPPRRIQELQSRVIEERDRLSEDDPTPSAARIAASLGVPESDVDEALAAEGCFTPSSLDANVGSEGGGASLGDLLPDAHDQESKDAAEARVMLQPVVRRLPARDRKLLRMRFFDDLTQQEIAEEIGVTQTQVSRLLGRILADLRRGLGEVTALPTHAGESPADS